MQRKQLRAIWNGMIQRCYNPTNHAFDRYGGRGITVCDRWHSFEHFFEDVGDIPEGLTLDRIDNDGGYSPENIRYADPMVQANNRRSNYRITYDGRTQTLAQWSREVGIPAGTIRTRLETFDWSVEEALTTPSQKIDHIDFNGKTQSLSDWSRETGIVYKTLEYRIKQGWPLEQVFSQEKNIVMKRTPRPRPSKPYHISHNRKRNRFQVTVDRKYMGSFPTREEAIAAAERFLIQG